MDCVPAWLVAQGGMDNPYLGNVSGGSFNNTPNFSIFSMAGMGGSNETTAPQYDTTAELARKILKSILVPIICVFGIVGNMLSLLILTRKRLKSTCDGTERTVHIGLIALAVSDLLCCATLLPHGLFKEEPFNYRYKSFQLIYRTYSSAFINLFILTSTWLTVTMATSRYLAICHPFKARHIVGITGTKASMCLVFFVCFAFNIPRFFENYIESVSCVDGGHVYFRNMGYMTTNGMAHTIYVWTYFSIGIFLPLVMLAFCNICLVKALRESSRMRRRYRVPAAHVDSNYRITSILVTIVVMYIVLVSPAEILLFLSKNSKISLVMAVEVTNVLQTINFACNFVLYFVLNVHFRHAMKDMMVMCFRRPSKCLKKDRFDRKSAMPLAEQSSLRQSTCHTSI